MSSPKVKEVVFDLSAFPEYQIAFSDDETASSTPEQHRAYIDNDEPSSPMCSKFGRDIDHRLEDAPLRLRAFMNSDQCSPFGGVSNMYHDTSRQVQMDNFHQEVTVSSFF